MQRYLMLSLLFVSLPIFSKVEIGIHNVSQDKDATHKALDYGKEKELRGGKKRCTDRA